MVVERTATNSYFNNQLTFHTIFSKCLIKCQKILKSAFYILLKPKVMSSNAFFCHINSPKTQRH